jgi:hypothetical protein
MVEERPSYEEWLKTHKIRETPDYDVRAAYDAGINPDPVTGHLDDTYKKTNHITYSDDSLAAKAKDAPPAGKWVGSDKDGWTFYASPTNVTNAGGAKALKNYFKKNEQKTKLVLPHGYADGGIIVDDGSIASQRKYI